MVDAAYWHLARRYNQAASYDADARAKLEELNEAYIVLGSAERREEYMKVRAEVLGEGTLPQVPSPAPGKPPLAVMSRQRPREREALAATDAERRRPLARVLVGAAVLVGSGCAGLAAVVALEVSAAVVAGLIIAILSVTAIAAGLLRLRGARNVGASQLSRHATRAAGPASGRRPAGDQPDQERAAELPRPSSSTAPTTSPDVVAAPVEAAPTKPPARDQLEEIKRQTAHFRRIAKSSDEVVADASNGDAEGTSQDLDKIRQQTERLKAIAAKFNAAKAQASSQPSQEDS